MSAEGSVVAVGGWEREREERDEKGIVYTTPCNARRGMVVNDMFKKASSHNASGSEVWGRGKAI